jgi:poly(hydroxyalkanoate) granule-associated protein
MPAKKNTKPSETKRTQAPQTAGLVQDSAQQIWLAGLGAYAKAQEEGSKAFQGLVKEGLSLQRQTKAAAEEKLAEASRKFSSLAEATTALSGGMSARAAQPWQNLESIFEERVAKALAHLGSPTAADIAALQAEVAVLKLQVAAFKPAGKAPAKPGARTSATTPAKKT